MYNINKKYMEFFESFKTVGLLAGGRNTGKSFFGAQLCLLNALSGTCNSFAFRRATKTAERDTASLIIGVGRLMFGINEWEANWKYQPSYHRIINNVTGNYIICRGIGRDIEDLKSFGDIQFVWVDEASNFKNEEITTLIPSIEDRWSKSKLLLTSNIPPNKRHWLYKIFISSDRSTKDYKALLTSYKDNPYINQKSVSEKLSALFPKGSSAYLREVLGQVPDFSNEYLINEYESRSIDIKFKAISLMFHIASGDSYVLAVGVDKIRKEVYVLGELVIPSSSNFFTPFRDFMTKMVNNYCYPKYTSISLYVSMEHYRLLYKTIFSQMSNVRILPIKTPFDLDSLSVFNYPNINLIVNKDCFYTLVEIELAEWEVKDDFGDEYKVNLIMNVDRLKYLRALCLSKFLI